MIICKYCTGNSLSLSLLCLTILITEDEAPVALYSFSLGLGEGKQLVCGLGQLGSQMSGDLLLEKFKMAFQAKLVRIVKLKQ